MSNTEHISCKKRFKRVSFDVSGNEQYVKTVVDLTDMKRVQTIFLLNVRLGNTDPCRCEHCNPFTGN